MDVSETSSAPRAATSARERSRLATRARLLASGRSLFAERGFHGVTSHDIARAAGVASGTFYLHFADKLALFREVVGEAIAQLRGRLQAAYESTSDPQVAVAAHAEALVSFAEENA